MPSKKPPPKPPPADVDDPRQRLAEAEAFTRLATRLAAAVTVDDMVTVTRQESEKLLGWDSFYFALRRPGDNAFRFLLLVDTVDGQKRVFPEDEERSIELGPAFQETVDEKHPVLLNRRPGAKEPKLNPFGDTGRLSASLMFIPIVTQDEVIGVISAQSYTQERYNQADLYVLDRMGFIVAPAIRRTHIEETLQHTELIRDDEYFVDDPKQEYEKLLRTIRDSSRHSDDNKDRFKVVLSALSTKGKLTRQQLEEILVKEKLALPANFSSFVRERLHNIAVRHGYHIESDGTAYSLAYRPVSRAIIFFSTEASDAEHLVNVLRAIDRSERKKLQESGLMILEAGGIVGDADVYCIVQGESMDMILSKLLGIIQNSQRTSYSKLRGKYLTAAEIISRTHTYPVVPGISWKRREHYLE